MGRSLEEVLASMPEDERDAVEARAAELRLEVDGLRELRLLAERTQEQLAQSLGIKQPSVHKMERQSDLYLSTLRRFVEAAGGTLELVVTLPGMGTMRLKGLADLDEEAA